jgi:ferredoxin-nitrite reductase
VNKIEEYKQEKDGLDVLADLPRFASEGWQSIGDGDKERLKWLGVFFRRQTPGDFMMRVRIPNGISTSNQFQTLADISQEFGPGFADLTTRQQIQLRGFKIHQVQEIWERLERVGLGSWQTGMDNIRNVVGCAVAGLTSQEALNAAPVVRQYTEMIVGNREFTNLPRKFNVAITGCTENCIHASTQDIALTPAAKISGESIGQGFNVLVGGKQGSGGLHPAVPLDVFVTEEEAALLCAQITLIFRDHGDREARNRCRLAFLVDAWGVERFRAELERRMGHPLSQAAWDLTGTDRNEHIGIFAQKQPGLSYVGLVVPVGRVTSSQLREVARLADQYGNGDIRITVGQNLIIANVPKKELSRLVAEPLLQELRRNASPVMRGLVSCTGSDYCHFALIETKERAIQTARELEQRLRLDGPLNIHWSGCPNACGNHLVADIGLLGKRIKVDGELVDAVDVYLGGRFAGLAPEGGRALENVPCDHLPQALEKLVGEPVPVIA